MDNVYRKTFIGLEDEGRSGRRGTVATKEREDVARDRIHTGRCVATGVGAPG